MRLRTVEEKFHETDAHSEGFESKEQKEKEQQQKDQESKEEKEKKDQKDQQQNQEQKQDEKKDQQEANSKPDEKEPGEQQIAAHAMTPEEAKQLLDAQKGDEKVLQFVPQDEKKRSKALKDW